MISVSGEYKREFKKHIPLIINSPEYIEVMYCLLNSLPLPEKYKDHALTGNWKGWRDCHIKNDLVLIYKVVGDEIMLARLNTHSEIFG